MARATIKERFVDRFLDPSSSLGEIVFGLIMVLTFTLGAGVVVSEGEAATRHMLYAAIGCNFAWGIIDGVLYILNEVFERGRLRRARVAIRHASDEATRLEIIGRHLDEGLARVLVSEDYDRVRRAILERIEVVPPPPGGVTRDDVLGASMSFALVFLSCIPAAIPFLLINDSRVALRVSNGLLLAMLFFAGWSWARFTNAKPWVAGTVLLVVGLILVGVAMALGG